MSADGENRDLGIRQVADKLRLAMSSESPPEHYIARWAEFIYENWVVDVHAGCRDPYDDDICDFDHDEPDLDEILEELIPK